MWSCGGSLRDVAPIGARPRAMLRVLSSMEAQAISGLKNLNETVEGSLDGLVAKLGVEDLADEAVERDGIEAHVRRDDHPRVDDLPLRQLLQDALEVILRVSLLAADLQVLALERHARGVAEAEDAGNEPPVHQLGLAEDLAVGGPVAAAGRDHEPRRDLDAPPHLHRPARPLTLLADEDVGQHVVASDDPGQRLAHHARRLEDVPEELQILPLLAHGVSSTWTR